MNEETVKFFAKYQFGDVSAKDFSDWAIDCLEKGIDSKNIRILASMFNAQSVSEIEDYFFRSLSDLNWKLPAKEDFLPQYTNLIAKQILNKEIDAVSGCHEIYKVYRTLDYKKELRDWEYLNMGMHPETYEDLVIEKNGFAEFFLLEEAIREEAAKLINVKITTVHQYAVKPDFEFEEIEQESFFTKIWRKIF